LSLKEHLVPLSICPTEQTRDAMRARSRRRAGELIEGSNCMQERGSYIVER
jgi:hypothetical protein